MRKDGIAKKHIPPITGCIYFVLRKEQELFYVRALLFHSPGATSFEDTGTINGVIYHCHMKLQRNCSEHMMTVNTIDLWSPQIFQILHIGCEDFSARFLITAFYMYNFTDSICIIIIKMLKIACSQSC